MSILDLLFPRKCAGCGTAGTYFCPSCVAAAKLHFPQVCPVCERPSLDGIKHKWCYLPYTSSGLTAIWAYEGVPRKLIHRLKYKYISEMAESLAQAAADTLKSSKQNRKDSPDWAGGRLLILPIPLHWMRENWRGFNHTEEVAKELARIMDWKVVNLLKRTKRTASQVGLKGDDRQKNIEGAFAVNPACPPEPWRRRDVLLFDDVWTTGATMRQATKVLKKAGFRNVWCLTLAR